MLEVSSSVICSVGQPAKSVAGQKRKAYEQLLSDESGSSSSGGFIMNAGISVISEGTVPSLGTSESVVTTVQSIGSDIIKKARRVQNKAKCLSYNSSNTTASNISIGKFTRNK